MDFQKLIEVLQQTLVPETQKQGESILKEMHKIIGYTPSLLQISLSNSVDAPIRQSAVIALKNNIHDCWAYSSKEYSQGDAVTFTIHENDKTIIRNAIVAAVVESPAPIRLQLNQAIQVIVRADYPDNWPTLVPQIQQWLASDDFGNCMGGLIVLHNVVKVYEYRAKKERKNLDVLMDQLLPIVEKKMIEVLDSQEEAYVLFQKTVVKMMHCYTQLHLNRDVMNDQRFTSWMNVLRILLEKPVPTETLQVEKQDRAELVWWKCKKWTIRIVTRYTERYGCPSVKTEKESQFAKWYVRCFSESVLNSLFKICEDYRQGIYISEPVLENCLTCIESMISQAFSWKFLKNHIMLLIQDVIFPLMCHTDELQELWDDDPIEYAHVTYDMMGDPTAAVAADSLLIAVCQKRAGVLDKVMEFLNHVLNSDEADARKKDGAFHMIGAIGSLLIKKKKYAHNMEMFMTRYVLPCMSAPEGYRKSRSCWLMGQLVEAKFSMPLLNTMADQLRKCLCDETDLPVRISAANSLMDLIDTKEAVHEQLVPHLQNILQALLTLLKHSEIDDLNTVMQTLISTFKDQVLPFIIQTTQYLVNTFKEILEKYAQPGQPDANGVETFTFDFTDDTEVSMMGLLSTLETIVKVNEQHPEIMEQLESLVVTIVGIVLSKRVTQFYEEVLSVAFSLTVVRISPVMWQVLELLPQSLLEDAFDYFPEMMPLITNYLSVDKDGLLETPSRFEGIISIVRMVLTNDEAGEDSQTHAAKILEMVLINLKGRIDQYVAQLMEMAMVRLTRTIITSELRTMCLQVIIAALYYNPKVVMSMLTSVNWPGTDQPTFSRFIKQWLEDFDCFLGIHDRRLCVLGMCVLLGLPQSDRPKSLVAAGPIILPGLIEVLLGLKRAYATKAEEEKADEESDSDKESDNEGDEKALASDEDEIDDEGTDYLKLLEKMANKSGDNGDITIDDDDDDDCDDYTTQMEEFETDLDKDEMEMQEFVSVYQVLTTLENEDPDWYNSLVQSLTDAHKTNLNELIAMANKCLQQKESKKIEQAGGYRFPTNEVPSTFNFGTNSTLPVAFNSPPPSNPNHQNHNGQ